MNRRRAILTLVAFAVALSAPSAARAAEGELDLGFGSGGTVLAPAGGTEDVANALALDAQGGIVAAGWSRVGGQIEFSVERFLDNGAVDGSFGFHGAETSVVGSGGQDYATGVAIDSAGRVVLAGRSFNSGHYDFAVVRYTPSGQPDASFSGDGIQLTPIGPGAAVGTAVAVDSQDRIVVAGSSFNGANVVFTLARYLPNGELDSSFGSGGIVNAPLVGNDTPEAMAIDPQGRIVLAGHVAEGTDDFLVARYLPGGSLDPSFGVGAGYVRTSLVAGDDSAKGLAIDPLGRIVVAGAATIGSEQLALVRYEASGALDPTFGSGGVTTTPIGSEVDAKGVAIDAQGRPVALGTATVGANREFALARYQASGALDPSFGFGGVATTPVGPVGFDGASALAIDPLGRIVTAGFASTGTALQFALARFIGDRTPPAVTIDSGPADGSFTNDPTPSFGFSSAEAPTTFSCGIDGAVALCASPFTTSRLADGRHVFAVTGADRAGNSSAPLTRTFTVDTKAPRLKIKGRRKFITHDRRGRAKFKLTASEPVTLKCKLDRHKPKPCKRRERTPMLKPGKHLLRVTATDRAGNVTHAKKRFRVIRLS